MSCHIELCDITNCQRSVSHCSHTALLVEFTESHFVNPYLTAAHLHTVVADTYHDTLYLLQRRITQHRDTILRLTVRLVVDDIRNRVTHIRITRTLSLVAFGLRIGQHLEREIEIVGGRPYFVSVILVVVVIHSRLGQCQRNLVLVVVILQVGTQAHETGQVSTAQIRVFLHSLSVHKHLETLVVSHVVGRVLIYRTSIFRRQVMYPQHHRLFVQRNELRLTRVGLTRYSRRQHVVNRRLAGVLFDIHRLDIKRSACINRRSNRRKVFVVSTPFATNQIQRRKTQVRLLRAVSHVHTHKADRLEVTDITHCLHRSTVAAKRYLKLVPVHIYFLAVTQRHMRHFLLGDMLFADLHHIRAQDNLVLIVAFYLVQRIVIIDIFDIRRQSRSRSVRLVLILRVRRVTFGIIELLIAVQNRHRLFVVIRAAVVVIFITRRVIERRIRAGFPLTTHGLVRHFLTHGIHEIAVRIRALIREVQLLFLVQTVQTHVLPNTCSSLVREGYCRRCRTRHKTPDRRIHAV